MAGIVGKDTRWTFKNKFPQDGLVYYFEPNDLDCYRSGNIVNDILGSGFYTNIASTSYHTSTTSGNLKTGSCFLMNGNQSTINSNTALRAHIFPITIGVWTKMAFYYSQSQFAFGGYSYMSYRNKSLSIADDYPISSYALEYGTASNNIGGKATLRWAGYNNYFTPNKFIFNCISISGTPSNPETIMGINSNFRRFISSEWRSGPIYNGTPDTSYPMILNGETGSSQWKMGEPSYCGLTFMYTRALTQTELSTIFEATRYRYGV